MPAGRSRCVAPGCTGTSPLEAVTVEILLRQHQILRACLGEDLQAALLRTPDLLGRFRPRDMEDVDRRVEEFGQRDDAVAGFPLDRWRLGPGVVPGSSQACLLQRLGEECDGRVVFGVDTDEGAATAGKRQHLERLRVIQHDVVIGEENLERTMSLLDQSRQFVQHGRRGVRDDHVEGIVDQRLPGPAMIVAQISGDRAALDLRAERDDGRRAARCGGSRGAGEGVCVVDVAGRRLLDMAVCVDAAGQHVAPTRIDLVASRPEIAAEGDDLAVADGDVRSEDVARGGDGSSPDHQIEFRSHGVLLHASRHWIRRACRAWRARMSGRSLDRGCVSSTRARRRPW